MRKPLTPSDLRENVYRILDEVLETGRAVEINRRGMILKIVPAVPRDKLASLSPHPEFLRCDPEDLVHLDWSEEWRP